VLDPQGKIDRQKTETLRQEMRAARLPKDEPFKPAPPAASEPESEKGTYLRKALVAAGFGGERCCT